MISAGINLIDSSQYFAGLLISELAVDVFTFLIQQMVDRNYRLKKRDGDIKCELFKTD